MHNSDLAFLCKKHIIRVSQPPQENVSPGSSHAGDMQGRIMSASNARIVDRYTPRVIPPERWKEISSFVRRSVSQVVTDDLTPDQVRTLLRLTTILTDHVVTAQGARTPRRNGVHRHRNYGAVRKHFVFQICARPWRVSFRFAFRRAGREPLLRWQACCSRIRRTGQRCPVHRCCPCASGQSLSAPRTGRNRHAFCSR